MVRFKAEVLKAVGNRCGYIKKNEFIMYLIWDCDTIHISFYHDSSSGTYRFKDTYLTMKSFPYKG